MLSKIKNLGSRIIAPRKSYSGIWTRQRQRQEERRVRKAGKHFNVSGLPIPEHSRGGLLANKGEVYR